MSYETVLSFLPGFSADILVKATLLLTFVAILDLSPMLSDIFKAF